jgi:uncharacterized small protein (TIGR04563 family)
VLERDSKVAQRFHLRLSVLREIDEEAVRLNRTLSWVVLTAWRLARDQIRAMPASQDAPLPRYPGQGTTPVASSIRSDPPTPR